MSARADVLLWAQRVIGRKGATACQILEIAPGSTPEVAQEAFHKIARMAHPDLHRRTLPPDELELVTTAYARAAAAYQEVRGHRMSTTRMKPIRDEITPSSTVPTTTVIPTSPGANKAVAADEPTAPTQMMNSKAQIHYRKAELALRRGELISAVLQLKMAVASDPQS